MCSRGHSHNDLVLMVALETCVTFSFSQIPLPSLVREIHSSAVCCCSRTPEGLQRRIVGIGFVDSWVRPMWQIVGMAIVGDAIL